MSPIPPRKIFKWIFLTITALIAMRLFFVKELIAAFLIFSVLFALLAAVVLVLVLLDHVFQTALSWVEACWKLFGRAPAPKVGRIPRELAVGTYNISREALIEVENSGYISSTKNSVPGLF
jgi:hypothetical protein